VEVLLQALRQKIPGLVRLLDANEQEKWMVVEFMPCGTIENHPDTFKGNAVGALKALRSLVETVAVLHKQNTIHRDIKPANVFIGQDGRLVLGDFGIVYLPQSGERLTCTGERVGSRTYMPTWANLGERFENVEPNFDVYMLGKLLWCMVSGCLVLPLWYHRRPRFDLAEKFPHNEQMQAINVILDKCIVEEPEDCLKSAQELLEVVDQTITVLERGVPRVDARGKLSLPCRMCGKGFYRPVDEGPQASVVLTRYQQATSANHPILLRAFVCNVCTHYEFFAPGGPEEAAARNWTAWRT
jgi:serine/threonine protein kinase